MGGGFYSRMILICRGWAFHKHSLSPRILPRIDVNIGGMEWMGRVSFPQDWYYLWGDGDRMVNNNVNQHWGSNPGTLPPRFLGPSFPNINIGDNLEVGGIWGLRLRTWKSSCDTKASPFPKILMIDRGGKREPTPCPRPLYQSILGKKNPRRGESSVTGSVRTEPPPILINLDG